jgi:hypothetical protein
MPVVRVRKEDAQAGREAALAAELEGVDKVNDPRFVAESGPQSLQVRRMLSAGKAFRTSKRKPAPGTPGTLRPREGFAAAFAEEVAPRTAYCAARRIDQVESQAAEARDSSQLHDGEYSGEPVTGRRPPGHRDRIVP